MSSTITSHSAIENAAARLLAHVEPSDHQVLQQAPKIVDGKLNGLRQVAIEARGCKSLGIFCVARDRNQLQRRGTKPARPELGCQLISTHPRKANIQQPDIGAIRCDGRQGRGSVMSYGHVASEHFESAGHHLGGARGGPGRRVELGRMVQLHDLGALHVARRLGGEAHHQDRADREVRAEEGVRRGRPGRLAQALHRDLAMTPHEFALRLERAGLPADAVGRLTRLFEGVRYGDRKSGPKDVNEAVSCLKTILHYCGEPV